MRVLIVDDDAEPRESLGLLLRESSHDVVTEGDPEQALRRAEAEAFDLVLCDVHMPKMDGLAFLRQYRAARGSALLIMMSAPGTEDAAVAAMAEGAYDYVQKPFRPHEVVLTIRKAEERERLRHEVETLRAVAAGGQTPTTLVAESRAMRELLALANRVAPHTTTVLITGERGTGKEVLAREIHRMSGRRERRFTAINCTAIPESLLEAELFGHVQGAFAGAMSDRMGLFEAASEGTLLLDEIDGLPGSLQPKLLRLLEEGEVRRIGAGAGRRVDVRLVASSTTPLEDAVDAGKFRSDLYYRLNVVRLHLPPLRERPDDIPALVTTFARQTAEQLGHTVSITPRALAMLTDYAWPGNVRELRNAIERAAVLTSQGPLDVDAFSLSSTIARTNGHHSSSNGSFLLKTQVEEIERAAIQRALDAANGNRREAANLLGVSLRTLFYKLRRVS